MQRAGAPTAAALLLTAGLIFWPFFHPAAVMANTTKPTLSPNQQAWRIALFTGHSGSHRGTFLELIVHNLIDLGWIEDANMDDPDMPGCTKDLWDWLAEHTESNYLNFLADGYYGPPNPCDEVSPHEDSTHEYRDDLLQRIKTGGDIDLIIAMDIQSGRMLTEVMDLVPVVVMDQAHPDEFRVPKGMLERVLFHQDRTLVRRQINLFYHFSPFKSMGYVYDPSASGVTMAELEKVKSVLRELAVDFVPCETKLLSVSVEQVENNLRQCHEQLARQKVEAVMLSYLPYKDGAAIGHTLQPLENAHIPTFAAQGKPVVLRGALMGLSPMANDQHGQFYSRAIAKIFNGVSPAILREQIFTSSRLCLNLETARRINYEPSIHLLVASDVIYQRIMDREIQVMPKTDLVRNPYCAPVDEKSKSDGNNALDPKILDDCEPNATLPAQAQNFRPASQSLESSLASGASSLMELHKVMGANRNQPGATLKSSYTD